MECRNYRSSRSEVFCDFIKKESLQNFSIFFRTPIFIEHLRWLLLELIKPISTFDGTTRLFISNTRLGKKAKSNTLRLNFCFLKIIRFLYPCYRSKIVGNVQKTKWVCLFWWDYMIIKFNDKIACTVRTVRIFYNSLIKHVHIFQGMIWHVQENVVKCFIIPLPRFSYMYWLIFTLKEYSGQYSVLI